MIGILEDEMVRLSFGLDWAGCARLCTVGAAQEEFGGFYDLSQRLDWDLRIRSSLRACEMSSWKMETTDRDYKVEPLERRAGLKKCSILFLLMRPECKELLLALCRNSSSTQAFRCLMMNSCDFNNGSTGNYFSETSEMRGRVQEISL